MLTNGKFASAAILAPTAIDSLVRAMRSLSILLLAASTLPAQVHFSPGEVAININGAPFTIFHYGTDANKPFLSPLRSASGKIITRGFPMENVAGESKDHLHHRGLWFSYDDVNGVKFWENDPSYTKPNVGKIVVRNTEWKDGDKSGMLKATMEWLDPQGQPLLVENRDMVFYSDPKLRIIDFVVNLTAAVNITFGDTKEGAFAIRLADNFTEKRGAKITDADGRTGMINVWGKRSNWVDYNAEVDGEKLGVAILDHPSNPHHPTYWHARDYGLFALNPFGQKAFDPRVDENQMKLAQGQKLSFRWRVIIHPGDQGSAPVVGMYKDYSAKR